jgi:hypothetical protein
MAIVNGGRGMIRDGNQDGAGLGEYGDTWQQGK